jgi:iron complex outermembrane receptor protein
VRPIPQLALAVLVAAFAAPALAQSAATAAKEPEAEAADASVEELIVTGTAAKGRTVLDSPVPVDLLSASELASSGAVAQELGQALAVLAPSFSFPRQSNSGTSDHVRAGQLRGLSPDQLLVLVNGKRRHPSAIVNSETKIGRGTAAVDLNTIPLEAVERVEILRDGAGAQYGSDAIAGVINILLDQDPEHTDIEVTLGEHITHLDPTHQDIKDGETFTLAASTGFAFREEGFLRVGIDIENRNATNRAGFDQIPFFEDPLNAYLAGRRSYAMGDPNTESYGLWFNTEIPVGEVVLYGFGTFGERETRGGAAFFRYPVGYQNWPGVYADGYLPKTRGDDQDLSFTTGVEWDLAGWSVDSSLGFGRNEFEYGVDDSQNPSLGAASPTRFDSGGYEFEQLIANVDATRDLEIAALAGPLTVIAGFEYRRESYVTRAGEPASYQAGSFVACAPGYPVDPACAIGAQAGPGLTPADEVEMQRDVVGLYADVAAEVLPRLLLDLAARYEHYSDFGGELTGKLSAAFDLSEAVTLRGAISNSFRAPAVQQEGFADTTTSFGSGSSLVRTRTLPAYDPIAEALGAEELDAETAFNLSFGITAQLGDFSASLDFFRITVDDRITLSERFFDDGVNTYFVDYVSTLPGGADVESVRYFTNAVDTRTRGVDVVVSYAHELFDGDFDFDVSFSFADTDVCDYAETPSELTDLYPSFRLVGVEETNTLETAAPKWKTVVTADWENDDLSLLARLSAFAATERVFNFGGGFEPSQRYGTELQLDLEGEYHLTDKIALALGVANVLDNYPDRSSSDINYFGNLPYDVLSPIGINGRYVYTRLSVRF